MENTAAPLIHTESRVRTASLTDAIMLFLKFRTQHYDAIALPSLQNLQ